MTGVNRGDGTEGGEEGNGEGGEERRRRRRRKIVADGTGRDDIEGSIRGPCGPKETSDKQSNKVNSNTVQ